METLKVPKHEIFDHCVLTPFDDHLLRIFSDQKDFVKLFILNLILNLFNNTRMLSMRMQSVQVHRA